MSNTFVTLGIVFMAIGIAGNRTVFLILGITFLATGLGTRMTKRQKKQS
jgi:hypothetical protein